MSSLGNKKIMAKNILYYMDKHQKTRNDMCDALGVKYTTFTDWVKGNSYPRIDKIELMANYFGISKADLVEEHTSIPQSHKKGVTINIYGRVAAGIPIEMVEDIVDTEEISEDMAKTGEYFGLIIKGSPCFLIFVTVTLLSSAVRRTQRTEILSSQPSTEMMRPANVFVNIKMVLN